MMPVAPEIELARRLVCRRALTPPVDPEALVQELADLSKLHLPFRVDGFCLDLKVPGKRARVFVNLNKPRKRQRFTLAHELGHLVIPWHVGSFVDEIDASYVDAAIDYEFMEAEANRFAAELLMPTTWVAEVYRRSPTAAVAAVQVAEQAECSRAAAIIALLRSAPPGLVYAKIEDGVIRSSSRSRGTFFNPFRASLDLSEIIPPANAFRSQLVDGETTHLWWQIDPEVQLPSRGDPRPWRQILSEICDDLDLDGPARRTLGQRLSGVVAAVNGQLKSKSSSLPATLYSGVIQRFATTETRDADFQRAVAHPKFGDFVIARIDSFFS